MDKRIVCFGELLLRLAPEGYERLFQSDRLRGTFGGGEANVAVSLANFGCDAALVTRLPEGPVGQAAVNSLRYFGVDTRHIVRGGSRVGIYYLEKGASQRGSLCLYDRAGSAMQTARREDFDWAAVFENARWFHFTGITPALGGALPEICEDACRAARAAGATVSCDLNYRGKLWSREEARRVMTALAGYVDVCIANEEDARDVFGIEAGKTDVQQGQLDRAGYETVARRLADRFGFRTVAITLRASRSASDNDWGAMLYDGTNFHFSRTYPLHIVDRVGGGDSFAAGLIYALLEERAPARAVEFAAAASALKHSIEGDFNRVSVEEVERLAAGDGSGRVRR